MSSRLQVSAKVSDLDHTIEFFSIEGLSRQAVEPISSKRKSKISNCRSGVINKRLIPINVI